MPKKTAPKPAMKPMMGGKMPMQPKKGMAASGKKGKGC